MPPVDVFEESAESDPMTKRVHFILIPRFFDGSLMPMSNQNGTFIIFDTEGLELGDTELHKIMIRMVVRSVTTLVHVEGGAFTFRAFDSIAMLVTMGLFGRGATAVPALGLLVNKATVRIRDPSANEFFHKHLQEKSDDVRNNPTRQLIRTLFGDSIFGEYINEQPDREKVREALCPFASEILKRTAAFTDMFMLGTGKRGEGRSISGTEYADYVCALVAECFKMKNDKQFNMPSVSASFLAMRLVSLQHETRDTYAAALSNAAILVPGNADYDGGRGRFDDVHVKPIKDTLKREHDRLVSVALGFFDNKAANLRMIDTEGRHITYARDQLVAYFAEEVWKKTHLKHFDHMRSTRQLKDLTKVEQERVEHLIRIPKRFLGIKYDSKLHSVYTTNSYVDKQVIGVRYNDDIVVLEDWKRVV